MMRPVAMVLLLTISTQLLNGCASDEEMADLYARDEAKKNAAADCIAKSVSKLDDGKTDPTPLALAVIGVCEEQIGAADGVETRMMYIRQLNDFLDEQDERWTKEVLIEVYASRAKK